MSQTDDKNTNRKVVPVAAFGIVIGVAFLSYTLSLFGFFQLLEQKLYDLTFQVRGPRPIQVTPDSTDIAIVVIDQETADSLAFPFDRSYYATVVNKLNDLGAELIVFDVDFSSVGRNPASDSLFYEAIHNSGKVVLTGKISDRYQRGIRDPIRDVKPPSNSIAPPGNPFGLVNDLIDPDGLTRRYPLFFPARDKTYLTLGLKALSILREAGDEKLDSTQIGYFRYAGTAAPLFDKNSTLINYFGPAGSFPTYSFLHVVQGDYDFDYTEEEIEILKALDPEMFDDLFAESPFKNKIVFIGASAEDLQDNKYTPFFKEAEPIKTPGVEVHAHALQMMMEGSYILPLGILWTLGGVLFFSLLIYLSGRGIPNLWSIVITAIFLLEIVVAGVMFAFVGGDVRGWLIILIAIVLGIVVFWNKGSNLPQWASLFVTFLLVQIIFFIGVGAFENQYWFRKIPMLLAVVLGYPTNLVYRFVQSQKEKAMIRGMFSQYVPKKVTEQLIANPEKAKLGGDKWRLSVLFTDVAGFTTVSEKLSPENLVLLLNEYLTAMTDIILENDGIVDKYEGDLIMAEFGAPIQYDDHAARCCRASLRMQVKLKEMRVKWREEGIFPPLYSRVGVNSGDMIVGNMGSQQVFDYTVMGDAVNLSSRLEGANKGYGTTIMIGHETWKDVNEQFVTRPLDLLQVKGKTEPVQVYELLAESKDQLSESKLRVLELFTKGLELYRESNFQEALAYFKQSLVLEPDDGPSQTYLKRCEMYIADPPPADWDGVWELTEK